ncbi:MAG: TMEM175 family protein [Candidatus Obscuribacterales bacterium]|nr:TMEM175 family protein [Candidatus Obscuribacterales bacterium]
MSEEPLDSTEGLKSERVATLADGVFAIVLTLLVIDLKAPEAGSSAALMAMLCALLPKFFSYVMTFVIVAIFWFGHHMEFHYIKRSDRTHLFLNLLFMMAIGFLPFSASFLGNNLTQPVACAFYGVHLAILGFIRYVHWRYCTDGHRLVDAQMSNDLINEVNGIFFWVPCAYVVASAFAFINVNISLLIYAALALRYIKSAKQDRHLTSLKKEEPKLAANDQ